MNERDSEQVASSLRDRGYSVVDNEFDADVVLLNTCSVRDQAEQKAIGKAGYLAKRKKSDPKFMIGIMGCMAQNRGSKLLERLPDLDLVVGTQRFHAVPDHLDNLVRSYAAQGPRPYSIVDLDEEADSQNTIRDHLPKDNQVRAFVSIMQGCNMKCSFCIVPYTRGKERGRPIHEIVDEVKKLADNGIREVTLLGQIVNLYGRHEFPVVDGKSPFVQLLEQVAKVDGIERVRFTSPHPVGYKQDLIDAFGYIPELAEHVHFPLQSGSDKVLRAMRRPYKASKFIELVERMREVCPDIAVSTDIIVGFPGEGDAEYAETRALCEKVRFDNAYVFRYSKRRGTPAAEIDESLQLSEQVKVDRNQDLLKLIDQIGAEKNQSLVETKQEVLCEGLSKRRNDRLSGRTRTNRIVIFNGNPDRLTGKLFDVEIERTTGHVLYGTPIID